MLKDDSILAEERIVSILPLMQTCAELTNVSNILQPTTPHIIPVISELHIKIKIKIYMAVIQ